MRITRQDLKSMLAFYKPRKMYRTTFTSWKDSLAVENLRVLLNSHPQQQDYSLVEVISCFYDREGHKNFRMKRAVPLDALRNLLVVGSLGVLTPLVAPLSRSTTTALLLHSLLKKIKPGITRENMPSIVFVIGKLLSAHRRDNETRLNLGNHIEYILNHLPPTNIDAETFPDYARDANSQNDEDLFPIYHVRRPTVNYDWPAVAPAQQQQLADEEERPPAYGELPPAYGELLPAYGDLPPRYTPEFFRRQPEGDRVNRLCLQQFLDEHALQEEQDRIQPN